MRTNEPSDLKEIKSTRNGSMATVHITPAEEGSTWIKAKRF